MLSWYAYAIMALLFMGGQRFLYKVSAERRCNTAWTTFAFMGTVALLSSLLFVVFGESVVNIRFLLLIALLNSSAFFIGTISHIEALKHMPAAVVYSIIRLNVVIVVVFSLFFFKDHLSFYQGTSVVLAIAVILILTRESEGENPSPTEFKRGLPYVLISLLSGAIAAISSKFAAIYSNELAFIAVSYFISTLFAFALRKKMQTQGTNTHHKDALRIGFVMGLLNFAGFYSFLKALSAGPLSIIVSIVGMHFGIAIILSVWLYKETLTPSRILGISLTILSVLLMRL